MQGPIPASLAHFDASAFTGNPKLCGPPLPGPPCPIPNPGVSSVKQFPSPSSETNSNAWKAALLVFGLLLLILSLVIGYAAVKSRRKSDYPESTGDREAAAMAEVMAAAAAASPVQLPASASSRSSQGKQPRGKSGKGSGSGGGGGELVMVNDEKGVFGMADLMTAAAEVLGNGGLGSVYKAVMANGVAVAVKRMREMNRLNREGFDREMRRLGRLRHPNLLTPLAYHFRKEEKLVISEFVPKGSLLYILHGEQGAEHSAIDFPARLKIVRGIASGMAYLHGELPSDELPHGNLKTANILLRADFHPLLADYGLAAIANSAASPLFAYKSPESPNISPKSDVFCFGVVVLEILTGKFPSQYLNNTKGGTDVVHLAASAVSGERELDIIDPQIAGPAAPCTTEMVRLLRLGVACTRPEPDERPDMKEAAELVEEIAAAAAGGGRGEIDVMGPVGPVPTWRDGHAQLPGSLRGRSEGSGKAAAAPQWTGDLFSL